MCEVTTFIVGNLCATMNALLANIMIKFSEIYKEPEKTYCSVNVLISAGFIYSVLSSIT